LQGNVLAFDGKIVGCVGRKVKQGEHVCVEGALLFAVQQNGVVAFGIVGKVVLPLQTSGCGTCKNTFDHGFALEICLLIANSVG